jgi:transglutaminase-like putative cysteine protease
MILIEISPGELIDKLTILEIKLANFCDEAKLVSVRHEYECLSAALQSESCPSEKIDSLRAKLKSINVEIWRLEDEIRDCERVQDFGPRFVELARSIYKSNDTRAELKRALNKLLNSTITEEKSYAVY